MMRRFWYEDYEEVISFEEALNSVDMTPGSIDIIIQTHLHFETLNESLLKQRPIPTEGLFFNYDIVLKLSSQADSAPSTQQGGDAEGPR